MTASEALASASERLSASHVPDANLEAEVLLRNIIDVSRAELYATLDRPLGEAEVAELERLTGLRTEGKPLAYILGCVPNAHHVASRQTSAIGHADISDSR